MAALGSLVVKLGLEYAQFTGGLDKSEQAALASAKRVQDTFDGMKRGIAATAGAVAGGLAAGFTVNAFTNLIQGSMQANAALEDLSMQTGASAAALKELVEIGKFNDMGPEQIGAAMNKLAANLAGATEESKGTGKALQALGIEFKTLKAMSPDVQMQTIATAMAKFEDGTGKSAVAMALFGKEGAKMIPMLTDLAEVEDLRTKLTEAQIEAQEKLSAQSANLDDNVVRITQSSEKWKKELAEGMIPALDLGAEAVLDLMNGSGGLREEVRKLSADGSIKQWTMDAIKGLSYVADAGQIAWRVLQSIGKGLGGFAAALVQAVNGDFRAAWGILKDSGQDMVDAFDGPTVGERFRVSLEKMSEASKNAGQEAQKATKGQIAFTNSTDQSAKTAAAAKDPFDALRDSILKTTAAYQAEEAAGGKLTEGQKKAIEALDQLRTGKVKVTEAQAIQLRQDIEAMFVAEESNAAREQFIKTADAERAARLKIVTAMEQTAVSAAEQNQSLRDEIELIGLTEEQQTSVLQMRNEAIILTKEATLAELERASAITGTMTREQIALQAEIEALKERNALLGAKSVKNTAVEAAKKAKDEWEKTTDQINQSLTDALMRGFESGKDFAKNLRDTVVNMFKTMVLRPVISAVLSPVSGAIAGVMGGGGGSGSNPIGMASNAYSMYNAGSQAWTLGSQYMAGTMSGANVLGTAYANATGGGIDALLATNGAYGTAPAGAGWMGQLGTAGGVFAAITGLAAAFGAFRKEVSVGGGYSGTFGAGDITGYDLRRESGYLFGGPDYTMVNPAQKIAELEAMRGKGTYLGGGWAGVEEALEQEIQRLKVTYKDMMGDMDNQSKALQTAYEALRTNAGDMADSLGMGSEAVRKFTTTVGTDVIHPDTGGIGIKLDGLKPEEVQAKIQAALATASNELAQQVIGSWETVTETVRNFAYEGFAFEDGIKLVEVASTSTSKLVYVASEYAKDGEKAIDTLTRLSTNLATVNTAFKNLGWTLMDKSLAGADAAGKFADKLGGLENFAALAGTYYENFYSEAEKTANVTRDITKALAKFGLEMPTTREGYRALVEQQQKLGESGTESGTESVVALINLSGAFASIVPVTDSVTESVKAMTESLDDYISKTARSSTEADRIRGLAAVGNTAALKRLGVPGYASGGYHSGGLRLVGENGPELEVTGPSQIISSPVTAQMLRGGGADTARLEALVEKLTAEVANLRAETRAVVTHTATTARIIKRVTPDGDAIATREAAPV